MPGATAEPFLNVSDREPPTAAPVDTSDQDHDRDDKVIAGIISLVFLLVFLVPCVIGGLALYKHGINVDDWYCTDRAQYENETFRHGFNDIYRKTLRTKTSTPEWFIVAFGLLKPPLFKRVFGGNPSKLGQSALVIATLAGIYSDVRLMLQAWGVAPISALAKSGNLATVLSLLGQKRDGHLKDGVSKSVLTFLLVLYGPVIATLLVAYWTRTLLPVGMWMYCSPYCRWLIHIPLIGELILLVAIWCVAFIAFAFTSLPPVLICTLIIRTCWKEEDFAKGAGATVSITAQMYYPIYIRWCTGFSYFQSIISTMGDSCTQCWIHHVYQLIPKDVGESLLSALSYVW